jgi:two-component system response regulator RpfG
MLFTLPDIDQETLNELLDTNRELLDEIEPELNLLLNDPSSSGMLNELFRNLHTVKGNFRMCFFDPFTGFSHAVEEVISEVRQKRLVYDESIQDACLLAVDKLREWMTHLQQWQQIDTNEMEKLSHFYLRMAMAEQQELPAIFSSLQRCVTGEEEPSIDAQSLISAKINVQSTISLDDDLISFSILASKLEARAPHWEGRFEMMWQIMDATLSKLPWTLDRTQLQAAVYIHDIGMSTVSKAIIDKTSDLTDDERKSLLKHPRLAWQYLSRQPEWDEAAQIVLQHHERVDGNGYPNGLSQDDIHPGARLLAVADAFIAMITERPDRSTRHTIYDAVKELTQHSGTQFDSLAVDALIQIAREIFLAEARDAANQS